MDIKNLNNYKYFFVIIAFLTFSISQLIGYLINSKLEISESYKVTEFFYLTHVRNHGGVFGSFDGHGFIFAGISIIILGGLLAYLFISKDIKRYELICFGFIFGGGFSNITDRFIYGSVIDYINIQGIPYWYYIFNSADTFIHIGVWPMILLTILDAKKEQN
jgi:signal peptidase II